MDRPPEQFRPDRPEVMNDLGTGKLIEIDRGVVFECLVGAHNNAKNLTTGIVRFAPAAQLAYHKHTFTESVTLLEGRAMIEIEGRRYTLSPLDNVVIPPGAGAFCEERLTPRARRSFTSPCRPSTPTRELVEKYFPRKSMADDSTGPGKAGQASASTVSRPPSASRPARARRLSTSSTIT